MRPGLSALATWNPACLGATAQVATARLAFLCRDVESALSAGESESALAREAALEAAATARGEGFEVTDDGEVAPSATQIAAASESDQAGSESVGAELERRARAHAHAIHTALDAVGRACASLPRWNEVLATTWQEGPVTYGAASGTAVVADEEIESSSIIALRTSTLEISARQVVVTTFLDNHDRHRESLRNIRTNEVSLETMFDE